MSSSSSPASRSWGSASPVEAPVDAPFGVYLHIPFCSRRCDYCAFAVWTDRAHLVVRYLAACRTHAERLVAEGMPPATSVFVGGGTPSLVPADELVRVLDAIPTAPGAEVTVECNPDTVDGELLATYVAHGVNRVSFGVQSMVPHVLASLGRAHDPASVVRAVDAARAVGVPTFNVDLVYGAAGESLDDWRRTLEGALALDPPHVSVYALTVEPGTPLAADTARHPDDDDQADKYLAAHTALTAAGRACYEISNWAKPGHACRHNLLYWAQGDYAAIGCAAHGHHHGRRFWNLRTPERYVAAVEAGTDPEGGAEVLDDPTRRLEGLQLALRTDEGVPAATLGDDLPMLRDGGLVVVEGPRAHLTVAGRLVANDISIRLR